MDADKEISRAVESLAAQFLGKLGIISIRDDYESGEPTLLVLVTGDMEAAQKALPSHFQGFPVCTKPGSRLIPYSINATRK